MFFIKQCVIKVDLGEQGRELIIFQLNYNFNELIIPETNKSSSLFLFESF